MGVAGSATGQTGRTIRGLHRAMPTGTPRRITFGMDALPTPHHTDTLGTRPMLMRPISNPAIAAMDAGICVRIRTGTIAGRLTTGRLMMTTRVRDDGGANQIAQQH